MNTEPIFDNECCVKGCSDKPVALGLCNRHWRRTKLYGSPAATQNHAGQYIGMPSHERFFAQVQKTDSCWIWVGGKDKNGYGSFKGEHEGVLHDRAHRYSYHYHKGLIGKGMYVCHACDTPKCVNPDHLFLGTARDNAIDRSMKGRYRVAKGEQSHYAKLTEEQARKILLDPRPYAQLAEEFGLTVGGISDIKNKNSWTHLGIEPVKGNHRNHDKRGKSDTFTEDDIKYIRSCDERNLALALMYNTTPQTICDIRKRRSWKHVA